ncbi:MAG TPA: N-formylglutamate deformylase [Beijerinckiaceae bacterium]|nr:N-formylglutamate deformylase [Beijerinckiaceae bacterium]
MSAIPDWLTVRRGQAPLIVSLPHTGTSIPPDIEARLVSPWLARKDADWWIDRLYDFAADLDATVVHTAVSRTVIDVNRDPSGVSLYPGQATTELCPSTTFDGESLYRDGHAPDGAEIAARRARWFDPYHAVLAGEIARLRTRHERLVLYDCHSIRSRIPRLFEGDLPQFNIGTNSGAACAETLQTVIARICAETGLDHVVNGRFKGGYITRCYGAPERGVHAVQMELACRGYMHETPGPVGAADWPAPYDPAFAAPMRGHLARILSACLLFAETKD